jgi:hypothetical protein
MADTPDTGPRSPGIEKQFLKFINFFILCREEDEEKTEYDYMGAEQISGIERLIR